MKTGFAVFIIGVLMILGSLIDPLPDLLTVLVGTSGLFLAYVGARLMKGQGSLVDNPTLW